MGKILWTFIFWLVTMTSFSQKIAVEDSSYIYKHFLFYHSENKSFDDIDEPFIEDFWQSQNINARKYFSLSAYLVSIPVNQRVIMISYLNDEEKTKAHLWIYNHLKTAKDTTEYFLILDSNYGLPYSKLKITKDIVLKYCPPCKYK